LVQRIYAEATQALGASLDTPLGKLSVSQIEKAEQVLYELKQLVRFCNLSH
jgi:hypothetical protein